MSATSGIPTNEGTALKILVVCQYYYPEQFRINEVCQELVRRGHEVTVLTGQPNYPAGEIFPGYENRFTETHNGVRILRCKIRPRKQGAVNLARNYLSFLLSANRAVKKLGHDFDVIYVYQLSPVTMAVPALKFKKKTGLPLYLYCLDLWPDSIRDVLPSTKSPIYRLMRAWCVKIYNGADHIGVTSPPFREYLHEVCRVPMEKLSYLPQHGEDMMRSGDLTARDNGCTDIVFLGNVGAAQDLETVARAVSRMRTDKPFCIHIVGIGSALESLKACVQELGVQEHFRFHGRHPITEMPDFYRLADACLLTLYSDNAAGSTIPGKLQGYMSAGKPVIAAINGAAAQVIREADCGICVSSGDAEGLAEALTDFIEHPERYSHCGSSGRRYFEEHFSLDIFVTSLEKRLEELRTCEF